MRTGEPAVLRLKAVCRWQSSLSDTLGIEGVVPSVVFRCPGPGPMSLPIAPVPTLAAFSHSLARDAPYRFRFIFKLPSDSEFALRPGCCQAQGA